MGDKACGSPAPVYVCSYPQCSLKFSRPSRLEQHFRVHTGEKPYKCDHPSCGKEYARPAHLKRHKSNSHVEKQTVEMMICVEKDCKAVFETLLGLRKHHAAKHSAAQDKYVYMCDYDGCTRKFKKHHQLNKHKCEHTGEIPRPFVCPEEQCGKTFDQGSHLKRHMKSHEGYLCKEDGCHEKFKHFNMLRKHMAIEHPKTFVCTVCDKAFVRKKYLNDHEKVHASERTVYECPKENCPRFYYNTRNLYAHIRSYHEGRRVGCTHDGCDRTFATKQKMQEHLKFHDPNKPLPKPKKKRKHDTVTSKLVTLLVRNRNEEDKIDKQGRPFDNSSDDNSDDTDVLSLSEDPENTDEETDMKTESANVPVQLDNGDINDENMDVSDDFSNAIANDASLCSNDNCKAIDEMSNDCVSNSFISHVDVVSNYSKVDSVLEKEATLIKIEKTIDIQSNVLNFQDKNMNSDNDKHGMEDVEIVIRNIAGGIKDKKRARKDQTSNSNGASNSEPEHEVVFEFDVYDRLIEK
ncbi:unnamed protein product [Owenia fusiformis]|uniref:Uncharacterized protein n=1 Tax=Owenia fusiformis TaxID=6347 RepID=A0A8J1XYH3_OWEFU|nr:unnamed protein product [Owenia fusiformis]